MANEHSVKIHNYLSEKITAAQKAKKASEAQNDGKTRRYFEGQLHELLKLREYMKAKIDLKTQKYY
jgi:hypothetical protein